MEWDLAWTGSLPRMLASFHGEPFAADDEAPAPATFDLLGHEIGMQNKVYPHAGKANRSHMKHKDSAWSSQQLMRFSRPLLLHLVESLRDASQYMFCEVRAPSFCARMARERHEAQTTRGANDTRAPAS